MSFPNLSALAVRERALTLFFLLLSVVAGVYAFTTLGRAEDPSFTVRIMVVSALWPGATPEEIEEQVADRLGHDRRYSVDTARIRSLGWAPTRDLDEGLAATVAWYRDHLDWWDPLLGERR